MSDYRSITRQFLRAVRGSKSQAAFNRKLGFRSNVAAEWESGRRVPTAVAALSACQAVGINVVGALRELSIPAAMALNEINAKTLATWLTMLVGEQRVSTLAQRSGLSRHQIARFLKGKSEPRLHQFLALINGASGRISDLLAACVPLDKIPTLLAEQSRIQLARTLAFDEPWTSAVLSAIECLPDTSAAKAAATLGRSLNMPKEEVARLLRQLVEANILAEGPNGYRMANPLLIDTGARSPVAKALVAHWALVGAQRACAQKDQDVFSYNVFSVSHQDLQRLATMQREYFQKVRALIAASPAETVAVLNLQLFEFPVLRDLGESSR